MVSHGNTRCSLLRAQPLEPFVTQFAGCHLDAHMALGSIGAGIKLSHENLNAHPAAESSHKLLVAQRLVTAQVEIAVSGNQTVSHAAEQTQKTHRVGASRKSHHNLVARTNQSMTLDAPTNNLFNHHKAKINILFQIHHWSFFEKGGTKIKNGRTISPKGRNALI